MLDMLVLAFQTDSTRVATFAFANEGSTKSYTEIDIKEAHYELSHHGGDKHKQDQIAKINQYHVQLYGYLLGRLKAIPEGEKTLLDNCALVYGSGISDGNAHNHNKLPIVLAGNLGGTIQTGRHLVFGKQTPLNNLWVTLLDNLGVKVPTLGDSNGLLAELKHRG